MLSKWDKLWIAWTEGKVGHSILSTLWVDKVKSEGDKLQERITDLEDEHQALHEKYDEIYSWGKLRDKHATEKNQKLETIQEIMKIEDGIALRLGIILPKWIKIKEVLNR
jgi:hypothetical protein